ncbi:hypothetical protein Dimus_024267 [Dionaea muscipula]
MSTTASTAGEIHRRNPPTKSVWNREGELKSGLATASKAQCSDAWEQRRRSRAVRLIDGNHWSSGGPLG